MILFFIHERCTNPGICKIVVIHIRVATDQKVAYIGVSQSEEIAVKDSGFL